MLSEMSAGRKRKGNVGGQQAEAVAPAAPPLTPASGTRGGRQRRNVAFKYGCNSGTCCRAGSVACWAIAVMKFSALIHFWFSDERPVEAAAVAVSTAVASLSSACVDVATNAARPAKRHVGGAAADPSADVSERVSSEVLSTARGGDSPPPSAKRRSRVARPSPGGPDLDARRAVAAPSPAVARPAV